MESAGKQNLITIRLYRGLYAVARATVLWLGEPLSYYGKAATSVMSLISHMLGIAVEVAIVDKVTRRRIAERKVRIDHRA